MIERAGGRGPRGLRASAVLMIRPRRRRSSVAMAKHAAWGPSSARPALMIELGVPEIERNGRARRRWRGECAAAVLEHVAADVVEGEHRASDLASASRWSKAPRSKAPRSKAPRSKAPRSKAPRSKAPRSKAPRSKAPRSKAPRASRPTIERAADRGRRLDKSTQRVS